MTTKTDAQHPDPPHSFTVRRSQPVYGGDEPHLYIKIGHRRQQLPPVLIDAADVEEGDVIWIEKPNRENRKAD